MDQTAAKSLFRKGIKFFLVLLASLSLLVSVVFFVVSRLILPPERLTPLVVGLANENLNAKLECESIELTLFSTFPNVGIRVTNGTLLSQTSRERESYDSTLVLSTDSLVHFDECVVSFIPYSYFASNKITIHELKVVNPFVFAHINSRGRANWDIVPEDTTHSTSSPIPTIDLRGLRMENGSILYSNDADTLFAELRNVNLYLRGALSEGATSAFIDGNLGSFDYVDAVNTFATKQRIGLKTNLELDNEAGSYRLHNAELSINALNMEMSGLITRPDDKEETAIDLEFGLVSNNLSELMNLIPNTLFDHSKYETAGQMSIGGTISGKMGNGKVPRIDLRCEVNNGKWNSDYGRIDTINLKFKTLIDLNKDTVSYIKLDEAKIAGENVQLEGALAIDNLMGNQHVVGKMKGNVNFGQIAEKWNKNDSLSLAGTLTSDLSFDFTSSDIVKANYGRVKAKGMLDIDNLRFVNLRKGIDAMIRCIVIDVDTESERIDSVANTKEKALFGRCVIDSFAVNSIGLAKATIRNMIFEFKGKTSHDKQDTTEIVPLSARYTLNKLAMIQQDSFAIRVRKSEGSFELRPSKKDKTIPELLLSAGIDTVIVRDAKMGLILGEIRSNIVATHYAPDSIVAIRVAALRAARAAQGDTTSTRLVATPRLGDGLITSLLRKWDGKSDFTIYKSRLRHNLFPIPVTIEKGQFEASTNNIKLRDAEIRVGRSDFKLNGEVENLRRTLLRNGKFIARLSIASDTIDVNEILAGVYQGINNANTTPQAENRKAGKGTIEEMELQLDSILANTQNMMAIDTNKVDSALFRIPEFIDLTLQTKAKFVRIYEESLNKVDGQVLFRDGNIQLTDMMMGAEFGQAKITMLYSPLNEKRAYAGFDLDIKRMQIDKLLNLYPPVDTMLPMLRSLEGVVDCQMAATTQLDSTMNIVLPTLNAACYIHGKSMVLLDGETFAEISKKLMFKNKKRNMIDSMAVELIIRDSKVEIFPFILSIDRYRCAVAGIQNLDMSFNYHISVLKSPLPFKIGVDVKGTLDKYNFKVTGAKLKESVVANRKSIIDSTQINLRKAIHEQFTAHSSSGAANRIVRILPTSTESESSGLLKSLNEDAPPPPQEATDSVSIQLNLPPDSSKTEE